MTWRMMEPHVLATIGVRLLALSLVSVSVSWMVGNVALSVTQVNPAYLGYYFATQLARPLIVIVVAAALWVGSRTIGKWIAKT